MTRAEKIGRQAWIGYLVLASPIVFLLVTAWLATLPLHFRDDTGPVEVAPPTVSEQIVIYVVIIGLPLMWIFGVFLAHRFENPRLRFIPFLANFIPALALLWCAVVFVQEEYGEFVWVAYCYPGVLPALLALGLSMEIRGGGLTTVHCVALRIFPAIRPRKTRDKSQR